MVRPNLCFISHGSKGLREFFSDEIAEIVNEALEEFICFDLGPRSRVFGFAWKGKEVGIQEDLKDSWAGIRESKDRSKAKDFF